MSGLVGYGSSDEENEIEERRPTKAIKTHHVRTDGVTSKADASPLPDPQASTTTREDALQPESHPHSHASTPAPGPHIPSTNQSSTPTSPPLSPYSTERQRIQNLTMPRIPNFSIPSSPPPPSPTRDPDAAASLAATTKKIERFLALKAQGVHFNDRLRKSAALRNPVLLPTLMEFAGVSREESYASALPADLGVPTRWREECYVESLVKVNERREKKRLAERDRVDFVKEGSKSAGSSAVGTPKGMVERSKGGGEGRRSRFDVDK